MLPSAFDQGVLSRPLTEVIEESGKHWVTEIERSRNIMWNGQWQRVDRIAEELTKAEVQLYSAGILTPPIPSFHL